MSYRTQHLLTSIVLGAILGLFLVLIYNLAHEQREPAPAPSNPNIQACEANGGTYGRDPISGTLMCEYGKPVNQVTSHG